VATIERIRELFDCDADVGRITWKQRPSNRVRVGDEAGTATNSYGYRVVGVDGKVLIASRVIWAHVKGEWPTFDIDHINGNRSDNRIANLRQATRSENQCNRRKQANNSSGFKGVYFERRLCKWRARIMRGGKSVCLGLYESASEASDAYERGAKAMHGDFMNTGRQP
jgi:hypothetical protein